MQTLDFSCMRKSGLKRVFVEVSHCSHVQNQCLRCTVTDSARIFPWGRVLSMAEGTDSIAVQKAARDFAGRELVHHKYVMALDTADTPHYAGDKTDPPTTNPHVHLIVQSLGEDGVRLNPRKADLHRWREAFAGALRDHGVEAVATSRAHRLDRARGDSQAVRHMKDKSKPFTRPGREGAGNDREARAQQTEKRILSSYAEVTRILNESEDATDRVLAGELADRFGLQRPPRNPKPRREEIARQRGADRPELPVAHKRTGTDERER